MRTALPFLLAVLLVGCDGATPSPTPDGPVRFGLANNDQSAVVSDDTRAYQKPLIGKVVRTASGITHLGLVSPLYADTVLLNGSPVAGAVACMDQPVPGGPRPTQLCNNTAADGTVPFFMVSGTKADTFVYHVNATVDGVPIQPDSARFVQVPGPATIIGLPSTVENVNNGLPLWFAPDLFRDQYRNVIPYAISVSGAFQAASDPNQPNGRGIAIAAGAVPGDTGTVHFLSGEAEILRASAKLTPGSVATTWGVVFTRE